MAACCYNSIYYYYIESSRVLFKIFWKKGKKEKKKFYFYFIKLTIQQQLLKIYTIIITCTALQPKVYVVCWLLSAISGLNNNECLKLTRSFGCASAPTASASCSTLTGHTSQQYWAGYPKLEALCMIDVTTSRFGTYHTLRQRI